MRFIKEKEAGRILDSLGIRKALNKIVSLGPILKVWNELNDKEVLISRRKVYTWKLITFVNLLLKRKSECKTGVSRYIYQTKLDKACFQHDMAYGGFKDN